MSYQFLIYVIRGLTIVQYIDLFVDEMSRKETNRLNRLKLGALCLDESEWARARDFLSILEVGSMQVPSVGVSSAGVFVKLRYG